DGYSLIAKIRQHPELKSTPAIALTGFGMKSDIQRAIADGYNAHLIKPADINDLSALLQRLVRRKGLTGLAS
ncbi:MAG: response regulator, partial [Acidobacteria bacterium]|nr:response regulator [Acidobacteriota bacterium]